jgi:hypothetical protein
MKVKVEVEGGPEPSEWSLAKDSKVAKSGELNGRNEAPSVAQALWPTGKRRNRWSADLLLQRSASSGFSLLPEFLSSRLNRFRSEEQVGDTALLLSS